MATTPYRPWVDNEDIRKLYDKRDQLCRERDSWRRTCEKLQEEMDSAGGIEREVVKIVELQCEGLRTQRDEVVAALEKVRTTFQEAPGGVMSDISEAWQIVDEALKRLDAGEGGP